MTIEIVSEPYDASQFASMARLLGTYFPATDRLLTKTYTDWLYVDNPFGRAILVRAIEGDRWAGFMALIPVQLEASGEALRAYYVVNVLVDPAFQGHHLFGRMISAAKALAAAEGAALMGHPNAAAHRSWQRARMVFHDDLRPSYAPPRPLAKRVRVRRVQDATQLEATRPVLADICAQSDSWRVAAHPEYLAWRYLRHPSNSYVVQVVFAESGAVGVQIAKRIKPAVHMLIDQFMQPTLQLAAARQLPFCTICFWPDSTIDSHAGGLWKLPWRKRIPVFFTPSSTPPRPIGSLGLSPSDF